MTAFGLSSFSGEKNAQVFSGNLVVNAKDLDEARRVADYIIDLPIPNKEIENKIESLGCEEIVEITNKKPP